LDCFRDQPDRDHPTFLLVPLVDVSPLKTNLFSYIGLGFGIILLVNILYLILWVTFSKWGLAFVSLLAIVLCYKPVTTYFPLHLRSPKPLPIPSSPNI